MWFKGCLPEDVAWASITHSHCLVLHSKRTGHFTSVTTSYYFSALEIPTHVLFIEYISVFELEMQLLKIQNHSFLVHIMTTQ